MDEFVNVGESTSNFLVRGIYNESQAGIAGDAFSILSKTLSSYMDTYRYGENKSEYMGN